MSPTAPTYDALINRLTKAHSRIRELQARETALATDNRTLRAAITELTHDVHPRTAEVAGEHPRQRTAAAPATNRVKSRRFPYV